MGIFWGVLQARVLWFGLFAIVLLGVLFYLVLGRAVESSVTEQLLSRQQTIARAEASNIISYFQTFGNSVAVLAQQSSIKRRDASAVSDMDTFVEQRRGNGIVMGVILTDRNGIVQFNSNVLGVRDLGKSIADRDYFVWAKEHAREGEYFISEPVVGRLGASIDQTIVVVASPVFKNGEFSGAVAASVKLAPLAERFFGLMKLSDLEEVYLTDGHENLLYSNSAPDSDEIKNVLSATEEGQFKTEEHLIAYQPIKLGTQNWLLIISSPAQEVSDLTRPFYVRLTATLILTFLTILLFAAMVIMRNKS